MRCLLLNSDAFASCDTVPRLVSFRSGWPFTCGCQNLHLTNKNGHCPRPSVPTQISKLSLRLTALCRYPTRIKPLFGLKEATMSVPTLYLPLKKHHIAPIYGLAPGDIKRSAHDLIRDREKIGHVTALSAIVERLGFDGGFAGFAAGGRPRLDALMHEHGLRERANLLGSRKFPKESNWCGGGFAPSLTHRHVSDRLFVSGKPLPRRIFTGYDFDWFALLRELMEMIDDFIRRIDLKPFPINVIEDSIAQCRACGDSTEEISASIFLSGIRVRHVYGLEPIFHLVGDFLVDDSSLTEIEPRLWYRPDANPDVVAAEQRALVELARLFRSAFCSGSAGWVDVIEVPDNASLIFLRGRDGEYDFVFNGLRLAPFEHRIHSQGSPDLRDLPTAMDDYQFERWRYFWDGDWEDGHLQFANREFYERGGHENAKPSERNFRKDWLRRSGHYKPRPARSASLADDFAYVALESKTLAVSNPVTVGQIYNFLRECPEHGGAGKGQDYDILAMNEEDESAPAAVSWLVAIAFCRWFQEKRRLPVRMPTAAEYRQLRGTEYLSTEKGFTRENWLRDLRRNPNGSLSFVGISDKFVTLRGMQFLLSESYLEWLSDSPAAHVRPTHITGFDWGLEPEFGGVALPVNGTCAYKGVKVGFRLCYELDPH